MSAEPLPEIPVEDGVVPAERLVSGAELVERICRHAGVSRGELTMTGGRSSREPRGRMSQLRWAVMHEIRRMRPELCLKAIGKVVGVSDHSSVIYALRRAEDLIARGDPGFIDLIEALRVPGDRPVPLAQWRDRPRVRETGCEKLWNHFFNLKPTRGTMTATDFKGVGSPSMSGEEIARRREEAEAKRRAHVEACLAAERARYGATRQTRVRPIFEQVA